MYYQKFFLFVILQMNNINTIAALNSSFFSVKLSKKGQFGQVLPLKAVPGIRRSGV